MTTFSKAVLLAATVITATFGHAVLACDNYEDMYLGVIELSASKTSALQNDQQVKVELLASIDTKK